MLLQSESLSSQCGVLYCAWGSSAAMHPLQATRPPRDVCRSREMVIYLCFPEWPFSRACIILTLQPEGFHATTVLLVLGVTHSRQTTQLPVHPRGQQAGTVPRFRRNLALRLLSIRSNETAAAYCMYCILGDGPLWSLSGTSLANYRQEARLRAF